ncbi:MAG: Hsp20/alpha crystallin family protein [Myxococcota bacterium]|nr:Hsp20/alpha crystallin family protein [Myxococcota bacterium]
MLTRWNDFGFGNFGEITRTFSALDELRREMDRMFGGLDRAVEPRRLSTALTGPRVNLLDTGSALMVKAEVPGVEEKDLQISLEEGSLTIRGERKDEAPEGYAVHRKERGAFTFSRAFTLPCKVDAEKTTAVLKNGVLELTMPKVPEAQPRQIQISAK